MASIKTKQKIENLLIDFADKRGYESSYCPSEIARAFKPESWRAYMDLVREIADNLVEKNQLVVLQNNLVIPQLPSLAKGPIRLKKKF